MSPEATGVRHFHQGSVGQLAVDEGAKFAGVDEEGLLAADTQAAFGIGDFGFREEPEADWYFRAVEELAGKGDHVVLRYAQDLRIDSHLRKCGVAQGSVFWGGLPAGAADVTLPWQAQRSGKDAVCAEVGMLDVAEGVDVFLADVGLEATDGEVHDGEAAGGGDHVHEFGEAEFFEAGAGVVIRQNAFEAWVVALDGDHGVAHNLFDSGGGVSVDGFRGAVAGEHGRN